MVLQETYPLYLFSISGDDLNFAIVFIAIELVDKFDLTMKGVKFETS